MKKIGLKKIGLKKSCKMSLTVLSHEISEQASLPVYFNICPVMAGFWAEKIQAYFLIPGLARANVRLHSCMQSCESSLPTEAIVCYLQPNNWVIS